LLELADANSFIAGVVGWVDLTSPEIELSTHPKFKGVRHLVESEPDDDWLLQPAVLSNLQKLSVHGLSYDLLVHTRHLKHVPVVVETCPELAFVIDHLAKPRSTGRDQRMVAGIQTARTLSKHYLQTIGLVTEANGRLEDRRSAPVRRLCSRSLRCRADDVWSDYPVCCSHRLTIAYSTRFRKFCNISATRIAKRSFLKRREVLSSWLMSETYFITGAQGCIGSWIVKALTERGDQAVVFDRSDDSRRLSAIMNDDDLSRVRFITGDITDGAAVLSALSASGAARVIHLAGLQVPTCKADPVTGALVNVAGTLNVFEAARQLGIAQLFMRAQPRSTA
jgi:hypothetical protein